MKEFNQTKKKKKKNYIYIYIREKKKENYSFAYYTCRREDYRTRCSLFKMSDLMVYRYNNLLPKIHCPNMYTATGTNKKGAITSRAKKRSIMFDVNHTRAVILKSFMPGIIKKKKYIY